MDIFAKELKDNHLLFILLGLAAAVIFAYSGVPGGLDVDSCNYAVIAKEIVRTQRWLGLYDPVYGGVFYYHFPLCIWVTAFFFKFLGISTFTAKLFSMLSALALVGVIFCLGRLLKNNWVGFFAGLAFLFTNHVVRLARQCRMDLPVSLFISLALLFFILAQRPGGQKERHSRSFYLLFGAFTSLAIMSKDVFGLAPLAIAGAYLLFGRRWRELFHPLFLSGLAIAVVPVLSWIWLDKNTLFRPWFSWNFLHLLKSPAFNTPWYYYIRAIINKYFYFLPFALYGGYLAVREARRNKAGEFYLLIIWALIFPLAFSFGRQKLHYFILPMYPAASLLAGLAFDKIIKDRLKPKVAAALKYILVIMIFALICLPFNIRTKHFNEIIHIAPFMDKILKQLPEYEFSSYRQDTASLLFYSQELSRLTYIQDIQKLEEKLTMPSSRPRLCYIGQEDLYALSPTLRQKYRALLKYRDKIVLIEEEALEFPLPLP